jgi:acetyl esterase/lipase
MFLRCHNESVVTGIYRGMDQSALDAAYNNTVAVANSAEMIADWDRRSGSIASAHPQYLDMRYGPRERNRFDYFAATRRNASVLVFIHGGYWQMRAKETFRFLAAGPLAHGISVANVGYTLAPEATLAEIVTEIHTALDSIAARTADSGADPNRLYVSGWSAGGHLTAMSLSHASVRGGLAISGVFDLEPIRLSYLNEKLRLDATDVTALSPMAQIHSASAPLVIAYGTAELPELQRQSRDYAKARERAGLPVRLASIADKNHFTILDELANPEGELAKLVVELFR